MPYKLLCMVIGESTIFSVKIDETDLVDELKDAIKKNNLCAPERRNGVMREATLEMAASR